MKIKIMYPNQYGNLEFKREELEKLLEEAYKEGYADGQRSNYSSGFSYGIYSSPSVTLTGSAATAATNDLTSSYTSETSLSSVKVKGSTLSK